MIDLIFKTVVGRWVTVGVVTLLLGGAGYWWYSHKEDLRDEGAAECVQLINQATIDELERALAAERSAAAELRASLAAAAAVNEEAIRRRNELSNQLDSLRGMMEEQRKNDETYRGWSDTDLPDDVADRLREARRSAAGSTD